VPVLLPVHEDAEYFDFPYLHFHIDFRFVSDDLWERMRACTAHIHACIVTRSLVAEEQRMHTLVCLRTMPEFPRAAEIERNDGDKVHEGLVSAVCALERHYRHLRIDTQTLICPHRGVCLKGLPVTEGTVVCPAHGLAWNVKTGALILRHSGAGSLAYPR
jgi:nitrite reductase/ring-hydroxylating ferredoxin subunit